MDKAPEKMQKVEKELTRQASVIWKKYQKKQFRRKIKIIFGKNWSKWKD